MSKTLPILFSKIIDDNNYLLLNIEKRWPNAEGSLTTICYLHKEDILFVINTFRKIGKEGYDKFGGVKEIVKHNEDDFVEIKIQHGNDRNSYGFAELCIYNNKSGPSITFQYDVDDPMNPEDSLYKFLMELEKYVPEEDKEKIIPQWR